jgi:hypothetical protein
MSLLYDLKNIIELNKWASVPKCVKQKFQFIEKNVLTEVPVINHTLFNEWVIQTKTRGSLAKEKNTPTNLSRNTTGSKMRGSNSVKLVSLSQ